jgi:hypothetical protein
MKVERHELILAFYPNARGFAYVLFEGPHSPVDWGISDVTWRKGRIETCVRRLSGLISRYRPDVLVLRGGNSKGRASAMQVWLETVKSLAEGQGISTYALSRKEIRQAFAHLALPTRYAIAKAIASDIPMFAPLLPAARKIWNGEDRRMGLFDATALALSYLKQQVQLRTSRAGVRSIDPACLSRSAAI